MGKEKPILIVTDERSADAGRSIAEEFSKSDSGRCVTLVRGSDPLITQILAADVLFIGCASPHPPEFAALEKILRHINLTLRRCGLFTSGSEEAVGYEAVRYLEGLVKDCGIGLPCPPLTAASSEDIRQWARRVADSKK